MHTKRLGPYRITPPHLPLQVGHLPRLQRLSCAGNSELMLPASMTQLSALRCLDLSWTRSNVAEVFELGVDRFQVRSLLGEEGVRERVDKLRVLMISSRCLRWALTCLLCELEHTRGG